MDRIRKACQYVFWYIENRKNLYADRYLRNDSSKQRGTAIPVDEFDLYGASLQLLYLRKGLVMDKKLLLIAGNSFMTGNNRFFTGYY